MSKIKFAVVGMGHIGKRHATMVQNNEHCELVAVADIDSNIQEDIVSQFNVPFFASIDEMLASGLTFDVVNICTPNGVHAELSVKALKGKHHVVCEKPMGLSKAECEEIIYTALHVSKHVFVVMQNRYSPPAKFLKSLIDENRFGEIYMVKINCYWNRDDRYYKKGGWKGTLKLDGGPLFTQFSHFLDIMYWLFGDITNIQTRFENFKHRHNTEFEDSGYINFEFVNGGIGSINYSTAVNDTNFESSITIIGEKGTVKVGGQYMDKLEYCHIENYEAPVLPAANPPNDYGAYKGSAANHHFVFENVVDTLHGHSSATTNALEGMKVVEIIERIYQQRKGY
jgi:UDP-N-acetyl-2-amino-2-deoxyglucuronate dehydrogenase